MPRRLLLLLLPLLLTALPGCEDSRPLKLGSNQWPGYEPVYLARELGLLPPDAVKLVELPSSSDVMQYLRNGSLDAGMLTLDEVVNLLSDGMLLDVILVMDVSNGADSVLAQRGIDSPGGIRGKRVGVEISALGALMLESLLDTAGLSMPDIELVNLTVDQHLSAFRNRRIDVLVTFEPTRSTLLAEGASEIFSSRDIPDRIIDVLAVRRDVEARHARHLELLVKAYFAARRQMHNAPEESHRLIALRLGTTPDALNTMYAGMILPDLAQNRAWLDTSGRLERRAAELAQLMADWHLIQTVPDTSGLANPDYLP